LPATGKCTLQQGLKYGPLFTVLTGDHHGTDEAGMGKDNLLGLFWEYIHGDSCVSLGGQDRNC